MRLFPFKASTSAMVVIALIFALTITMIALSDFGAPAPAAVAALLDGPDQPVALDVATDGSLWLALRTDFFGGGARLLDADLNALGGFATRSGSRGIAVDAHGDLLLLEADGFSGADGLSIIERYMPDGLHQGTVGSSTGILDFDAAGAPRSAWSLIRPSPVPDSTSVIPRAARFDDGTVGVPGLPTFADVRRIAGAPDGTFYVATDFDAAIQMVIHYSAAGIILGSWPIEHPIGAIAVNRNDGSVWVASGPPPMPDLSKTRVQGFPAGGGTPSGTAFADFEMDIDAIDIAAWSVRSSSDAQCHIYGVGTFGIGALWTIVRHDCDGTLLASTRDIPQVGSWTPVPTMTITHPPTPEPTATIRPTDSTPPTETAEPTETGTATGTAISTVDPGTPDPGPTMTITHPPTPEPTHDPLTPVPTPEVTPSTYPPAPSPGPTMSPGPHEPPTKIFLPLTMDFAFRAELSIGSITAARASTDEPSSVHTIFSD